MAEITQIVLLPSEEAALAAAPLFPGSRCVYSNGRLSAEALSYNDGVVFGPDSDWRNETCGQLAKLEYERIREVDGDISDIDGDPLEWVRSRIKPYSAPQVAIPVGNSSGEVAGKEDSTDGSPLPSPDTPAAAEPSQEGSGRNWSDANLTLDHDEDERAEIALHSIRMASARKSQAHADGPEEWPDPADFWGSKPLPAFNPEWVIPCLRSVSANNAAMIGCDQGIDYLQRIAFAAGCLSDDIKVRVRANQNWTESARIWACIVGDSGDGKSPSMVGVKSAADDLEFEIAMRARSKMAAYKLEMEVYEMDRRAWVTKKHKGEPAGDPPIAPDKPVNELLYFSSTTAEGLLEQQEQSTRGIMLEADEVLGWATGMDQYKAGGKGSDKAFWLSSWNGAKFVGILVGKLRTIPNTGVTIIGGTQPGAIRRAMTAQNFTTEDGLVQRFLIYNSNGLMDEDNEQPADSAAIARWKAIVHRLYYMKPNHQPCVFSPQADAIRLQMNDWLTRLRTIPSIAESAKQALSKWRAYFPRLCLTLAAIEAADEGQEIIPGVIGEHIAQSVFRYMTECLWPNLLHFYISALENDEDNRSVRAFAEYVLARDIREFSTTNLRDKWTHYKRMKTISQRREFWANVQAAGWVRPASTISRNEGIASRYAVNPAAFDGRFTEQIERAKAAVQQYRDSMPAAMIAAQTREPGEE